MAKKKKQPETMIKNCTFTGVSFDEKACESIDTVATGLLATAKGLCTLAEVFKAQNIQIETLLMVNDK